MIPRKKKRRYKVTTRKGITLKTYVKAKNHKKLPEICKVYTRQELEEFAKSRGMKISND